MAKIGLAIFFFIPRCMVSIPPIDQHVHRFLWGNFETDRELDTYVKTVLTFGDRPAPTMAITALHKTTTMKEDQKPKVAEAIIKNSYVDDICDSKNSAQNYNQYNVFLKYVANKVDHSIN